MSDINKRFLDLYCEGKTYDAIGKLYGITRERVRQKIYKQIEEKIIAERRASNLILESGYDLDKIVKDRLTQIKQRKKNDINHFKKNRAKQALLRVQLYGIDKFKSLRELKKILGNDTIYFQRWYSKIYDEIRVNIKKRWSIDYDCCKICENTFFEHRSNGICQKCYGISDEHKAQMRRYQQKNLFKIKEKQIEYQKRPEVRKRLLQLQQEKAFEGNREKAIQRDKEKCVICEITREKHREIFGKDLFVHRRYSDSNDLNNLVTLCQTCHISMNSDNYEIL